MEHSSIPICNKIHLQQISTFLVKAILWDNILSRFGTIVFGDLLKFDKFFWFVLLCFVFGCVLFCFALCLVVFFVPPFLFEIFRGKLRVCEVYFENGLSY